MKASELAPNPRNWREHPEAQRAALQGILAEIGYADACLVRELPDGTLELVDGHLRQDLDPDAELPCLILDIDEAEAAKLTGTAGGLLFTMPEIESLNEIAGECGQPALEVRKCPT